VTLPARPRGARRRSWREVGFASLDFETTGLDHDRDAVVSFGVVPIDEGRIVLGRSVHRYVSPEVPSSVASMKIHQILPNDLSEAPPIEVAREELRAALDGRFVLAWYASVERAFLRRSLGGSRRAWRRRMVDVRDLAIGIEGWDPESRFSLSVTAERYGVPVDSPHDALDDALVTAQLFLVLAERLEREGCGTVRDLLRLTRR
jgi:DNA polymerase-3 subunit epsilon